MSVTIVSDKPKRKRGRPRKSEQLARGTPPDTSLHLGEARLAWLKDRGGIQPTLIRMIDEAMKSPGD